MRRRRLRGTTDPRQSCHCSGQRTDRDRVGRSLPPLSTRTSFGQLTSHRTCRLRRVVSKPVLRWQREKR
ncbi:hypothetical protein RSSM_01542 [Rhodopirellula sallentina SM41]|uniref:Uncharacterized protein n=1 Tax=Rhodopirellula sallentina SM41 TaxID=1263870 RepID=M5ULX0_9BACT|nr:hypothetical protein RSSM_01542 [Rhodopirellula sallentina SM41]